MAFKSIALVLSTVGYLLFLIFTVKIRAFIAPFVLACFVVTSTYFFAISGHLSLGVTVTIGIGLFLGILALLRVKANINQDIKKLIISFIWVIPVLIYYFAIPNDFKFLLWDEVGGWARSQKLIFDTDALLNANSPFSLRSYPPGQQIFQYYVTKMTFWSEKNLILAQNIFIFSALLAVVGALIKNSIWACVVYATLFPIIYFFNFDYNTIYCDPLIVAVFAACLSLALKPTEGPVDVWVLAVCLCGFILLKDIALVFTALVIFVYLLGLIQQKAQIVNVTLIAKTTKIIQNIFICIVSVSLVIISWKWYVSVIGTAKTEIVRLTLEGFMQEAYRQRAGTTITAFIHALLKPDYFVGEYKKITINLSMIIVIALIMTINGLIILFSTKEKRINSFLISLACTAGAVGYLIFLLWLYLTYFTEYEGTRLASFDRYSMTYLLAWLLVTYAWLMSVLVQKFKSNYAVLIPLFCAMLVYCFVPSKFYSDIKKLQLDQASFEKRKATQELSDKVRNHIKPGEKVYFLAQNTNGYERHLFDYAMLPFPPNDCWSVGKKYSDSDVWTCDQPLGLLIKDYAYLAIYTADEKFWKDNANLFDPGDVGRDRGVYKINVTPGNQYQLKLVEP